MQSTLPFGTNETPSRTGISSVVVVAVVTATIVLVREGFLPAVEHLVLVSCVFLLLETLSGGTSEATTRKFLFRETVSRRSGDDDFLDLMVFCLVRH